MDKILARRFSPFNFSVVPGFPNVVPTVDEWGDYLPIFRERKEDNPARHLHEFHELMHQWEIHHEDVLMKMFMFSLDGDAREWYRSLPPASISSLEQFHAAFNKHCQRYYSSELICHNCCKECDGHDQDMVVSNEIYEDEGCEEEEDVLGEVMELVKSLTAQLERLESEESAEDFPVLEADVLGSSTEDDNEDFITVEALISAPEVPVVPSFDDYSDEEQQSPTSQFVDQRSNQPVYDSYESDSELDMQDFQEQTAEPYPLFAKEKYYEEINHPGPAEDTEQHEEERDFSQGSRL
jgi:hypothetical protein